MSTGSRKEEEKWTCDYCTYANWPSTVKCTMCRGPKPYSKKDIYELRDESRDNSPPPTKDPEASGPLQDSSNKWPCDRCTYLNWSHASQCLECGTPRTALASFLHERLQPLRISEQNEAASVHGRTPSPPLAIIESDRDVGTQLLQSYNKWACPVCTYENWPKAGRCAMCSNPAPKSAKSNNSSSGNESASHSPSSLSGAVDNSLRSISSGRSTEPGTPTAVAVVPNNCEYERRRRQLRRQASCSWLSACLGVVEGDLSSVEAFLSAGGDPARQLTAAEVALLNRPSAFDVGYTLVHLAIRFHREDMLATLLSQIEGSGSGVKRVPSYVAPDLAADIRRHVAATLRQRKGSFPCFYATEAATFTLPAEVEDLPTAVQDQLLDELLDKDAQETLESEPRGINWCLEVTVHLGSRLYALWNRSAGDCLLDSAMQATWGVFDRDNTLRRALADSLHQGGHVFYPRWKEYEASQAQLLDFSLDEGQWEEDWAGLLSLASQPGASLEQLHVFALAHILRRPIIIYGVKYVKSFRGEDIGYARFEGVYLPLLWEPSFCVRSPIALGYTRGHFTALVPIEPFAGSQYGASQTCAADHMRVTFLPLMDRDRKLLPVHFLTQAEMGQEDQLLRQWLDVCVTDGGLLVAQQRLHKRPLLVAQMVEEWLNHYRRLAQMTSAPFVRPTPVQDYSSEGDSDEE